MANQQPHLLAPHPGNDDPQQPQQALEELSVQLDLLPLPVRETGGGNIGLSVSGGLLLRDGVVDAVDQGDEEGEIDGARDFSAVLDVGRRSVGEELGQGSV